MSALCLAIHVVVTVWSLPESLFTEDNKNYWFVLFCVHLFVMAYTFPGRSGEGAAYQPGCLPVLNPSPRAVLIGRSIAWLALGNVVYWAFLLFRIRGDHELLGLASALALLSAVYLAVIWGLGAENIWSPHHVARARREDPLFTLSASVLRAASAKRRAIPFGEWMTGLLQCCELAAQSTSTVRDATDIDDPRVVDCVEFYVHVLVELESRACHFHYRNKLSREGHRRIGRFIHSVASIRCQHPEPLKWQNIVDDAKAILSMRDTLLKGDTQDS